MYLRGRGKIGYITGDTKQPDVDDKTYAIWDAENSMDLDLFNDYEWKSKDDCNQDKKIVDLGRIFKFLAGLNVEYDEVRGRIIGRNSLPPIGEVFAEVRREESRRHVMLGKKTAGSTTSMEGSALAIPEAQLHGKTPNGKGKKSGEHSTPQRNEVRVVSI
ncbi:hypothetical protein Pint_06866 [Pistacia integerrima]|uniref:Uncharacterized protein n=1 Tax=Pistacia integerrima TaxID=434235 RepID=A0ACC0XYR5_9ROSI|nr:hypothetical protein Pint_06866 [Pistacia integerrima]